MALTPLSEELVVVGLEDVGVDDAGGVVGGDQDEFQEPPVASWSDHEDAHLTVVLLLAVPDDVVQSPSHVVGLDVVLEGAVPDLHAVIIMMTRCSCARYPSVLSRRPHCGLPHCTPE
jgi:hypothetical protein